LSFLWDQVEPWHVLEDKLQGLGWWKPGAPAKHTQKALPEEEGFVGWVHRDEQSNRQNHVFVFRVTRWPPSLDEADGMTVEVHQQSLPLTEKNGCWQVREPMGRTGPLRNLQSRALWPFIVFEVICPKRDPGCNRWKGCFFSDWIGHKGPLEGGGLCRQGGVCVGSRGPVRSCKL
jgi:hypothetical protein